MTANEAKAALCAHLGIADHGWAYLVGQIEGRLPARKAKAAKAPAPTDPGLYNLSWPDSGDPGDVMELMADGRWRFVQGDGDPRNPSDPLPFIPGGVFTRLPDPPPPARTLELSFGR